MTPSAAESIGRFRALYGTPPELAVEAAGRVNLVGGSTDYNEGFVLPVTIDRSIRLLAARRGDGRLEAHSTAMQGPRTMPLSGDAAATGWARHLAGILLDPDVDAAAIGGIALLIDGDLPPRAGLGSSAALGVGFLTLLDHLAGRPRPGRDVVEISHRAETRFVGTACGRMDQFAAVHGAVGQALRLDCRSMTAEAIPFPDDRLALLLFDSGVPRELAASGYNDRRRECEAAAAQAQTTLGRAVATLRDLEARDLPRLREALDPPLFRRCRHIVTENERVLRAARALGAGALEEMGREVSGSHRSLRDDFEVSTPELDEIHQACRAAEGVYGARLTGAGFGGSLLALCHPGAVERVTEGVVRAFRASFGREPATMRCRTADGLRERPLG